MLKRIWIWSVAGGVLCVCSIVLAVERHVPSEYPTIQPAIDDCNEGDTVVVADGTYTGAGNRDLDFGGKAITVRSANGPESCTIDCNGTELDWYRGFYFHSGEDTNSVVKGFTIQSGYICGGGYKGGGVYCTGSSPTIEKCIITNNTVRGQGADWSVPGVSTYGAGIYCGAASSPNIKDCVITSNYSQAGNGGNAGMGSNGGDGGSAYGAGICCTGASNPTIENCIITANQAQGGNGGSGGMMPKPPDFNGPGDGGLVYGGGIFCGSDCNIIVLNCVIADNQAYGGTGGNSTFFGAPGGPGGSAYGTGIFCESPATITNSTVTNNSAVPGAGGDGDPEPGPPGAAYGSGINSTGPAAILNCIIWGNDGNEIDGIPIITYSDIKDTWPGQGNINADPCFADPCGGDYHLQSATGRWDPNSESWVVDANTSACIDSGDPNWDWRGELWPHGKRINMGAYGGTVEASMSLSSVGNIANLDDDVNDIVDGTDLGLFVEKWCYEEPLLAEDLDRDGLVNFVDFAIFAAECSGVTLAETSISYQIEDCDMGAKAAVESGETRFTVTVLGSYIYFEDMMTANCCPDELFLEMDVDGNAITLHEREVLSMPCFCICDYPVTATVGPFEAGVYTLEVYEDYGGFIGSTIVSIGP